MVDDYRGALAFVLVAEGGYVDDPDDPGGATNLGIEQGEYDLWRRSLDELRQSVKDITQSEASAIYKSRYWDAVHGDYIPKPIAWAMFDSAVNIGCGTAIKMLQRTLAVQLTCCFDRATSDAFHSSILTPEVLANRLLDLRVEYYHGICTGKASLRKFLAGWLARVSRLRTEIS